MAPTVNATKKVNTTIANTTAKKTPTVPESTTVPMISKDSLRANLNTQNDLNSRYLSCPEDEKVCSYVVKNPDSKIGDIMHRFNISTDAVNTGEAKEKNEFKSDEDLAQKTPAKAKSILGNLHDKVFGSVIYINKDALPQKAIVKQYSEQHNEGYFPYD